jgi:hypothetical protein
MKSQFTKALQIKFLLFFILSVSNTTQAQRSMFYSTDAGKSFDIEDFGVEVYNLNFIKNNEYFNFISDGLTLLGSQVHPEVIYNNNSKTQFRAGVFLLKHFGENNIDIVIPTFSFVYNDKQHQLTLGNFSPRFNHNLIEPLLASEKLLSSQVIETGVQYKYTSNIIKTDLWMDWEDYIRKYSDVREVFTIGAVSKIQILKDVYVPFQYMWRHRGGQINKKYRDENNLPGTSNITNVSIGLEYHKLNSLNNGFTLGYYYLQHSASSRPQEYPFETGNAHFLTLSYKLNELNFLLAYYKANKFISSRGNEMFQTYSLKSNINYWNGVLDNRYIGHTEPDRSLLFSKVFYEKELASNVKLGIQLEGFYQLNDSFDLLGIEENKKHQFDYSYGIFVIFNDVFNF